MKISNRFKLNLFNKLIAKNGYIEHKYWAKTSSWKANGLYNRFKSLLYLLYLKLFDNKGKNSFDPFLSLPFPESHIGKSFSFENITKLIEENQVISFDLFDTLFFRKVVNPKDIFSILSAKYDDASFYKSRVDAEASLINTPSAIKYPSIEKIYQSIPLFSNYSTDSLVANEFLTENDYIISNPFMKSIYDYAISRNKTVVITSDMYFSSNDINRFLLNKGYAKPDYIFVSSDYDFGKKDGELFKLIDKTIGINQKKIHIGDNYIFDFLEAKSTGWSAFHYPNINSIGNRYRPSEMKSLTSSLYKSLLNFKLHSTPEKYNSPYEFGYVYAGIIAYGFCQWIDTFSKNNGVDFLIFTARDSKVFFEVYSKYFNNIPCEYVHCSRAALLRASFPNNYSLFFDIMFEAKAHNLHKITVSLALKEAGLEALAPLLKTYNMDETTLLLPSNLHIINSFIEKNVDAITEIYKDNHNATFNYYSKIISNFKNIAVVDLGWRGTSFSLLKSIINKSLADSPIHFGLVAGTTDSQISNYLVDNQQLYAYMFSHINNTDMQVSSEHLMQLEIIFSAQEPGTNCFVLNEKGIPIAIPDSYFVSSPEIDFIHKGIYDFCDDYHSWISPINLKSFISGREAYTPMRHILKNKELIFSLFGNIFSSDVASAEYVPLKTIMKKLGY